MHELSTTIGMLRVTPETLRQVFEGLSDEVARANYGPQTFSPFDVVGHLILGERLDWMPRTRLILEHGDSRPFDPFPWDGVDTETAGMSVQERLDVFSRLRQQNLQELEALDLQPAQLELRGTHPKLGTVTLGNMLSVWPVHDSHHVAQICKAVNFQFRHQIGPWRPYLNSIPPEPVSAS